MPLEPGTTLGVYEVLSAVGAGGMGEDYRSTGTELDGDAALRNGVEIELDSPRN